MNTKNLLQIITLVAATLSITNLNAAEAALSPKARATQIQTAPATTADPNLFARNPAVAASPKVLAMFPQLAGGHTAQAAKPMMACACCKP